MRGIWGERLLSAAAAAIAIASGVAARGHGQDLSHGVLDEHPAIQYALRPTTDRVAKLNDAIARGGASLGRDPQTGYLRSALEALRIPSESQLLVFSKTGVQSAYTSPQHPRSLFFNESVAVGYIPGAPVVELAAHDPQQGVVFYTLDQTADAPAFRRRTNCLMCHVSSTTLDVPGMIVRSNTVGEDGNLLPQNSSNDVDHRTPHPDRWGGWFVTSEGAPAPYAQRAHSGNITFSGRGNTSSQVFIDWMNSSPGIHGYLSPSSDIVALLVFDHQMHAINLVTRLNWESRVAPLQARSGDLADAPRQLAEELAEYLLFVGEVPPSVPLTPRQGYADHLRATLPKDARGRSCGDFDLVNRLFRYPCSYMLYSEAFDGLPPPVKSAVYRRMREILTGRDPRAAYAQLTADDRRAVLEILRETKPDFPGT